MTRRTQTHITDTLAVREIISKLPGDWLVRGLEERDYGIDLSIELYDGENPTGCFGLIQVKGTSKSFSDTNSLSLSGFPTKTLKYAELFPEAFFIFHTSTVDKETYFVWAQKYIELKLNNDRPGWKDQDTTTIHFPETNILGTQEGNQKIEMIMKRLSTQQEGLRFLVDFEWLKFHVKNSFLLQSEVLKTCIGLVKKLKEYKNVYHYYDQGNFLDLNALIVAIDDIVHYPITLSYDNSMSDEDDDRAKKIEAQLEHLELIKHMFLNQSLQDEMEEKLEQSPY
ncbi:DUF4365 domain-containing protein [Vibrio alginolyticus]|uniref:DUF4365 domain-containing protein n=1 Tax=Vibrio parahaemolyticus TaxID=670 RepID=UPI0021D265D6|nr:DUF4365 domain-containing protein [Vibrio alginolyticus]HCH3991743.1 DUF4365 domain-containing protein [Vibrio parahaemolyticus]